MGTSTPKLLSCFCFSLFLSFGLKVTDKVKDSTAVQEVAWVHTHRPLLHQPILPVLAIHGERLPHHKGGTHYAYDETGYLTDATEIEHDNENEDCQQASCKEEEILRLQTLELYRPAYTLVDFPISHLLQEEGTQDSGSHDEEDARTEPARCGLARIGVA